MVWYTCHHKCNFKYHCTRAWVILLKTGPKKVLLSQLNKLKHETFNYHYISDLMYLEK